MTVKTPSRKGQGDHWTDGGQDYSAYRPTYPMALADARAALAPEARLAVDAGCGTGQLSTLLAGRFDRVIATDISGDQIANATAAKGVTYHVAPAEQIPAGARDVDLITVAQAAHWLDLDAFYGEAKRVARPGAVMALISYGVLTIDGPLQQRFQDFYWRDLKDFWPPERRHVETGYADLYFPFEPIAPPSLHIERDWDLRTFLGYLDTWSAVKAAYRADRSKPVADFHAAAHEMWPDEDARQRITWPLNLRLGRL